MQTHKNEFIVEKKVTKKESPSQLKEQICDLLEINMRQLGSLITQAVQVQDKMIDEMKRLLHNEENLSVVQLRQLRDGLEKNIKIVQEQQIAIQNFLYLF